mmetsp:Transcript_12624/g.27266  ORF Transcript_12624/g.27266 Transcript_12624/m.27266 type:complete len:523 (-) Transcript_12624:90-1658(-)
MKLSIALLASALASANADGDSAAARMAQLRRHLSFSDIAGYPPGSQVTDHCALDLDQAAMQAQLSLMTPDSFQQAQQIYNKGGHSKSYALITLTVGLASDIKKGEQILGKNAAGTQVNGKAAADYESGLQQIKVYYATTDVQESYMTCRVGALVDTMTDGCFVADGVLTIDGKEQSYVYDVATDNKADRTIAGFSTGAEKKMRNGCKGCPYPDFMDFYNYYGTDDYAHQWVEAAFEGTQTPFNRGGADFRQYGLEGREQAIKKGTVYLNILMYVIRELEDALDDCESQSLTNNYNSVHAWDEGVCFYTGSIEGVDGVTSDGKLLHQLADKRCGNFRTCGEEGTSLDGMSKINHDLFDMFALGNHQLSSGECSSARQTVRQMIPKFFVPMIQGTLRYAYKVDKLQGGEVENAEGAVFAAAVLPKVYAVSPSAAGIIYDNMKVSSNPSTDFVAVKNAFQSVYAGLGITCADIGGLWFDGTQDYYEGMEPCDGAALSVQSADENSGNQLKLITSFCVTMLAMFSL